MPSLLRRCTGRSSKRSARPRTLRRSARRDEGWGKDFPEMLRNDEWNYAVFTTAKQLRPANQAECLACHKPLDKASYTFTLDRLTSVAKAR
jgi:hypothetical protein